MKGIYLCSRKHRILEADLVYNDIINYPGIDLCCDCLDIDLSKYDYIIATPPCNYYSRANWRRETSIVAQTTKHLLPTILDKCLRSGKPFIIENVCNKSLLPGLDKCYWFEYNNHIFYSSELILAFNYLPFFKQNKQYVSRSKRDGNKAVDLVIRDFLYFIGAVFE